MDHKLILISAMVACSATAFLVGRISSGGEPGDQDRAALGIGVGSEGENSRLGPDGQLLGPRAAGQTRARERSPGISRAQAGDPIARMESIMNEPDPLRRTESWLRFVKDLDPSEIQGVVESFRAQDLASANLAEYAMLLSAWARQDPYAALDYAKENTGTPFARQAILTSWATTDPVAAIQWAQSNHEGEDANPWMVGVIRGIASTDPKRATELLEAMPYSRERAQALAAVQNHYLRQGPEAARNWALGIRDEQLRDGAITRIAQTLAKTDPRGTAEWLLAHPGEGSTRALRSVMASMAEADLEQAMGYFQGLPDETLRGSAFAGITDHLAGQDPQAAARLIDANPALATDDVVESFVWNARGRDPELAANAIATIRNDDRQMRAYRQFLGHWMRRDMDSATDWIQRSELPPAVQRSVEAMRERMNNADR